MAIEAVLLKKIIEGALMAAGKPLSVKQLLDLFSPGESAELDLVEKTEEEQPSKEEILATLEDIQSECQGRGYELKEVGSGWRFQVVEETAHWVGRLWEEKPQRYSRALLETLALIAYRQPITRGDIESIRGVAVSSNIIKTLSEREWVKVVGHRDVPGRPALYATTKEFLDYFNLKSLDELPSLKEIKDLDKLGDQLDFGVAGDAEAESDAEVTNNTAEANDTTEAQDDSETSDSKVAPLFSTAESEEPDDEVEAIAADEETDEVDEVADESEEVEDESETEQQHV